MREHTSANQVPKREVAAMWLFRDRYRHAMSSSPRVFWRSLSVHDREQVRAFLRELACAKGCLTAGV